MTPSQTIAQCAALLGFDRFVTALGHDVVADNVDADERHDAVDAALLDQCFGVENPADREFAILGLIELYPASPDLTLELRKRNWLADRPLERGAFCWDALNLIAFPPAAKLQVAELKMAATLVRNLFPSEAYRYFLQRHELAIAEHTVTTLHNLPQWANTDAFAAMKSRCAGKEAPSAETLERLIEYATEAADVESAILLETFDAWPSSATRDAAVMAITDRAKQLIRAGWLCTGAFLLSGALAVKNDCQSRCALIELLIDQNRLAEAREVFERSEPNPDDEESADLTVGIAARLALLEGNIDDAASLLASHLTPGPHDEALIELTPHIVTAGCMFSLIAHQSLGPLFSALQNVQQQHPHHRSAAYLLTYRQFADAYADEDFALADDTLLDALSRFPAYQTLWFHILGEVQQRQIDPLPLLAKLTLAVPYSHMLWAIIVSVLEPSLHELLHDALESRFAEQTHLN